MVNGESQDLWQWKCWMRGVPFACWCRQQRCLALLLLTGYVTAIISFWVSLSSFIPPFVIFFLLVGVYVFNLRLHFNVVNPKRLQNIVNPKRLRNVVNPKRLQNVVNTPRKRLRNVVKLRKRRKYPTKEISKCRKYPKKEITKRRKYPKKEITKRQITLLLKTFTSLFFASTISFTPSILQVYVHVCLKQRYVIVDWFFTSTFTSVFNSSRLRSRL